MFKQCHSVLYQWLFAIAIALSCGVNKNAQGLETATPAAEKVIVVPGNYSTIQAAIDAAEMNTVINVKPGDYEETLNLKSGVSIKGLDTNSVVIYCTLAMDRY